MSAWALAWAGGLLLGVEDGWAFSRIEVWGSGAEVSWGTGGEVGLLLGTPPASLGLDAELAREEVGSGLVGGVLAGRLVVDVTGCVLGW